MRANTLVYLSGPMTGKHGYTPEENTAAGLRAFMLCLAWGIPAFCPHLNGAFPSLWLDVPYDLFLDYDFRIIERSTHVLMLPRWETSTGAIAEHNHAIAIGVPVFDSFASLIRSMPDAASPRNPELVAKMQRGLITL